MDKTAELEKRLEEISSQYEQISTRHRAELAPLVNEQMEIAQQLGPIYAGFAPGDMIECRPDRFGRTRRARVVIVLAERDKGYSVKAISVRRDGSEGGDVFITNEHRWKKI